MKVANHANTIGSDFLFLFDLLYVRSFRKVGDESVPSEEYMSQVRGNWLNAGNTQVLINHKLLFECIKSKKLQEKYDLFMFRP